MFTWQAKLLGLLVLLGALWASYEYIRYDAVQDYKAKVELAQAKIDKQTREEYNTLSAKYEELKTKRQQNARVIEKQVDRIVEIPVYSNVCLESNGLSILNDAIKGTNPGKPTTTLPADSNH